MPQFFKFNWNIKTRCRYSISYLRVFSEENNNREHSIMDAFSRKCKNKSFFLSVEQTSGKILPLENGNFPLNRNNKTVQARIISYKNSCWTEIKVQEPKWEKEMIWMPLLPTNMDKTDKTLFCYLLSNKRLKIDQI